MQEWCQNYTLSNQSKKRSPGSIPNYYKTLLPSYHINPQLQQIVHSSSSSQDAHDPRVIHTPGKVMSTFQRSKPCYEHKYRDCLTPKCKAKRWQEGECVYILCSFYVYQSNRQHRQHLQVQQGEGRREFQVFSTYHPQGSRHDVPTPLLNFQDH